MPIYTALGPIDAETLGATSMHEHVLIDARVWLEKPAEPPPADPRGTIENLGFLRWNPHSLEDNLVMDDPDVAICELRRVAAAGGAGIADMTTAGLGRRVCELPAIARASGVHVMVGCGFYVHDSHPDWVEQATEEDLERHILRDLREGIDGT